MTGGAAVALACAFAAGAAIAITGADHQRGAASCQAPQGDAVIDPAPALHHNRARESWALNHPLACEHGWLKNCPDFKPCSTACLAARVDDPRALGLEVKRDLKNPS